MIGEAAGTDGTPYCNSFGNHIHTEIHRILRIRSETLLAIPCPSACRSSSMLPAKRPCPPRRTPCPPRSNWNISASSRLSTHASCNTHKQMSDKHHSCPVIIIEEIDDVPYIFPLLLHGHGKNHSATNHYTSPPLLP